MIVHCTKKLAEKLSGVDTAELTETSRLGSWHAHLYRVGRRQCLMFCHDATRFILFMPGVRKAELVELGRWHRQLFLASLRFMGVPEAQLKRLELLLGPLRFDSITDRSVLGTINIARRDMAFLPLEDGDVTRLDPLQVSLWLNHRPVSMRGKHIWPEREMLAHIDRISGVLGRT